MTANAADLTTLATLQSYLLPGSNDNVLLQRLLTAASVAIEQYTNRDFVSQSYSDVFDGTGGRLMMMPQYPITAVASVTINGTVIPPGDAYKTAGFYFSKNAIMLNGYSFCQGYANVAIAWTAGYSPIPYDIEQFCIATVQYWLNDRQRGGESSRSMGGQTISYVTKDMPDLVKTGLNQYKRVF